MKRAPQRKPMRSFTAWIVAFPNGGSWGMPHRIRRDAIADFMHDRFTVQRIAGPNRAEIRRAWNAEKRRHGVSCVSVLVTEWGATNNA